MRGYVAWMLVALLAVAFYVAVTEGPIRDAAWQSDCDALARGEAVVTQASQHDYIDRCKAIAPRPTS